MKLVFLTFIFLLTGNQFVKAQTDEKKDNSKAKWHVNKQYDEDGNLIAYDSVYSWSSTNGNIKSYALDSLKHRNHPEREFIFPFPPAPHLLFFENDSLFLDQFFPNEAFQKEWKIHKKEYRNMLQQIDSIHRSFYRELKEKRKNKTL